MTFGHSWQDQVANYLMINKETLCSWIDQDTIPAWVKLELKPLADRRAKETQFALNHIDSNLNDYLHADAILKGQVNHYNYEKYNFNDVQEFIENQKFTILDFAKQLIRDGQDESFVLEQVKSLFLNEQDIVSYLKQHHIALSEVFEIERLRLEAYDEVMADVNIIFTRYHQTNPL